MLNAFETGGSSPPRSRFAGYFPGEPGPDFRVANHGSLFLLQPLTSAARAWCADNLPADATRFGQCVVVEPRFIRDIVAGALGDGMRVR